MERWTPTLSTQPLSEDYITDGDKLLQVIDLAWKSSEEEEFELDEWQRDLIRRVLERYPDDHPKYPGQLRYKEVVISMGRQNGKTVLGAVFALYGLLLHCPGPTVVGVAGDKEQADNLFQKVKFVVDSNSTLTKRYKSTNTRGLYNRAGQAPGKYVVKAGGEKGLQGYTISLTLADELHLWKEQTWNAISFGSSRPESIIIGITTAGDENSELLKRLYKKGRAAAAQEEGYDERFGFFLWEAPEHLDVTDPEAIIAANPAVACGRKDLEEEVRKVSGMPENQAKRYRLNQFVSSESSWLPQSKWNALDTAPLPHYNDVVFAVDRTDNWTAATITANVKHEGKNYSQVVASIPNPSLDWLEAICADLWDRYSGLGFVMEVANLRDLAARLKARGIKTEYFTQGQMINASATVYSLINEGHVVHAGDDLLKHQVSKGVAKNVGEGWRISRKDSVGDIDSLLATVMGLYAVEVMKPQGPLLFVA